MAITQRATTSVCSSSFVCWWHIQGARLSSGTADSVRENDHQIEAAKDTVAPHCALVEPSLVSKEMFIPSKDSMWHGLTAEHDGTAHLKQYHLGRASLDVDGDVTAARSGLPGHDAGPIQAGLEVMWGTWSILPVVAAAVAGLCCCLQAASGLRLLQKSLHHMLECSASRVYP